MIIVLWILAKTCTFKNSQIKIDTQKISIMNKLLHTCIMQFWPQGEVCNFWPNMQDGGNNGHSPWVNQEEEFYSSPAQSIIDASMTMTAVAVTITLLDDLFYLWNQYCKKIHIHDINMKRFEHKVYFQNNYISHHIRLLQKIPLLLLWLDNHRCI